MAIQSPAVILTHEPIAAAALIAAATRPDAGAIATFFGTTRAERRRDGVELIALDYQAYDAMALELLSDLRRRAVERFKLLDALIVHRLGRVPLAEPSVAVVAVSAHRAEALAACQWLIDALKTDAPIWKRDIWADGATDWSKPNTSGITPE